MSPTRNAEADTRIEKKTKTRRRELSPHRRAMIEGMHLAKLSSREIARLMQIPNSTVRETIKRIPLRSNGQSLPRSGRPPKIDRAAERNILRYCRQNAKVTYAQIKRELALDCDHRTIARLLKKHGIKNQASSS
jgi:transposase